ncbi:MAG: outer membrane lipid asymmetry maintenance protein MlaD [Gammaproteobacteria bacterium]|nr:outer membrane lipid asymmetry maintenance protein MlaD [Gammaproteobacteria bacterium]MCW8839423.1 outer membrane lipid asymmetry maintenance protein MlaD [Gammaproteobacteria bacterium]MCW8927391.1 outer membrane lipid asymmetry maintenance protein MlaD [Gammaproteobacteria bacterium]MCW8959165.1 outer membrane lipid asymmetry maintenance protein MlaD [Gammaproteobacteria bacterium]MCW8971901.1 outer membrane lipid asymmetry maintenance protein MlaD [Gammaproteobacteria bacterium]
MLQSRSVEIWVGLFIAAGMAALFMLAMQVSNLTVMNDDAGYSVTARFENISGLKVRSPVTMAGVRIGRVTGIGFDPKTFQAVVTMNISSSYNELPLDTSAAIYTSGLLGEQYVGLEPGGDFEVLKEGDEIMLTQSAIILEQMIGQFLFSQGAESESK